MNIKTRQNWTGLWKGNPAYEQLAGKWPIGWVLETENGKIVGSIGNIPITYQFKARKLLAATPCSWAVDPPYRGYSMLILTCVMTQENVDLVICTSVSSSSEPSFRAFQWSKVPVGTWNKSAFWITNYRGFSQTALTMRSVPMPKVMSVPLAAVLFCRDSFRRTNVEIDCQVSEIRVRTDFDGRFDQFWQELKKQNPCALLPERSREALDWHFRHSLMGKNVWIVTASQGPRLVAYAIFDRWDNTVLNLKRIRLVDFQALAGYENLICSTLSCMLRKCRNDGTHVLEYAGCWLERAGAQPISPPYQRTLSNWTYYYRARDKELCEALKDPKAWAPSSFDGDASL